MAVSLNVMLPCWESITRFLSPTDDTDQRTCTRITGPFCWKRDDHWRVFRFGDWREFYRLNNRYLVFAPQWFGSNKSRACRTRAINPSSVRRGNRKKTFCLCRQEIHIPSRHCSPSIVKVLLPSRDCQRWNHVRAELSTTPCPFPFVSVIIIISLSTMDSPRLATKCCPCLGVASSSNIINHQNNKRKRMCWTSGYF